MTETRWANRITRYGEAAPADLRRNPRNWRTHPRAQQDALAGVLSEVGWAQGVVVNERTGHLVDGHARVDLAVARKEPAVPVVYVDLSAEEEAKVLATLDPIGAMAGADPERLAALVRDVTTDDAALRSVVRDLAEANGIALDGDEPAEVPEPEVDRAEELREKWGTAPGQLWEIGRHRLLCGDATRPGDAERLTGGGAPRLLVTDPPYGVAYDPEWRDVAQANRLGHGRKAMEHGDETPHDWSRVFSMSSLEVAYCWAPPGAQQYLTQQMLEAAGYEVRQQVVWVKPMAPLSRSAYHWRHEPCWYGVRRGATAGWVGGRTETTVWEVASPTHIMSGSLEEATPHPTQKPLECMARPIRNHEGDVYDPFVGSGTTLVAAQQEGRLGYGLEVDPKYVAVTLERLAQMGLEPRLVDA